MYIAISGISQQATSFSLEFTVHCEILFILYFFKSWIFIRLHWFVCRHTRKFCWRTLCVCGSFLIMNASTRLLLSVSFSFVFFSFLFSSLRLNCDLLFFFCSKSVCFSLYFCLIFRFRLRHKSAYWVRYLLFFIWNSVISIVVVRNSTVISIQFEKQS